MFIIDDRYKNYGLEYTMSYTLTQYQTTPGISRDYVSTFELGSFSANICSPFPFHTHNLNHVSVFLYLCLSCVSLACPTLPVVAPSPYLVCWLINIRDSVFLIFLLFAPIVFLFSSSRQTADRNFFLPPPGSCHPLFHFSPFTLPFIFLTSFSQLASLPACCCCVWASVLAELPVSVCPCELGWKGFCVCLLPQREGRQVSNTKPSAPYTGRGTSTGP